MKAAFALAVISAKFSSSLGYFISPRVIAHRDVTVRGGAIQNIFVIEFALKIYLLA